MSSHNQFFHINGESTANIFKEYYTEQKTDLFELPLFNLTGGLGGRGGSFIPIPRRDTGCPITLSMLESFRFGNASSPDSAEEGDPLASLPLMSVVLLLLKMGSL